MWLYVFAILVGAVAWRGAASIITEKNPAILPLAFINPYGTPRAIASFYSLAAPVMAAINGYAFGGVGGLAILVVGTWLGMLGANIFLRFNPAVQFYLLRPSQRAADGH